MLDKLSMPQKAIYEMAMVRGDEAANISFSLMYNADFTVEQVKNALNCMLEDCEVFRTKIEINDGVVTQCYVDYKYEDFEFYVFESESEFEKWKETISQKVISIYDKLYHFVIYKINNNIGVYFKIHHIISDAWSAQLVCDYLTEMLFDGERKTIFSYTNYIEVEDKYLSTEKYCKDKEFWLNTYRENSNIGYINDKSITSYRCERKAIQLTKEETKILNEYCYKNNISPFNLFLSGISVFVRKAIGKEQFYIGTPILNRSSKKEKDTMGVFVNTIALPINIKNKNSFKSVCMKNAQTFFSAYKHQKFLYAELLRELRAQNIEKKVLYDILVSYQNVSVDNRASAKWDKDLKQQESLCIHISNRNNDSQFLLEYNYQIEKYDENDIEYMHKYIMNIIFEGIKDNSRPIDSIDMLSDNEKDLVLQNFNDTYAEYPRDKTVVELFEEQVEKTPDNVAVIFEEKQLTYRELNKKANQVAYRLRELGVGADDFVAIITERSLEMIIGIYGIIKAGGAYVPIDPTYPIDRIRYMLEDCNPKVVLIYKADVYGNVSKEIDRNIITIDLADSEVYIGASENPEHINKSEDLIYCIYTSGTTGKPKGTMLENRGLINRIFWMNNKYPITNRDRIMQKTTYTFDVSVWEIFWWSFFGSSVVLLSVGSEKDPESICNAIDNYNVTTIHFVPSMLNAFLGYLEDCDRKQNSLNTLKYVFASGEKLLVDTVKKFYHINQLSTGAILTNLYGPTEASIDVTYFDCSKDDEIVPIGKPIFNIQIYIVKDGMLCGVGMPGELCIAGVGVARGYLNREELTAEKFIDNPYGTGKLYKTGDLARWLSDGNIEYLGRIDEQVKIRGLRIELGEIESHLREVEGIRDCAVIAREDSSNEKAIYAYYTSENELDISVIRDELARTMPSYMVPSYMMRIESIPVTKNGKLDKRALPEIEGKVTRKYIAPRTKEETVICNIFSEILNVENVGITDNFFENGGDSIKAIRIISKLRAAGYSAAVKDVMTAATAEKLALVIEKEKSQRMYEQGEVKGFVEKTPIIKMYDSWNLAKPHHFNQANIVQVTGVSNDILIRSMKELVIHHDILRAVYRNNELEILGVEESKLFDFYEFDYRNENDVIKKIDAKCTEIQGSIDLASGPIVKVGVFETDTDKVMMIAIHHLAVDGVSWRIISEDLETLIKQMEQGEEPKLPEKTASFIEWSQALNNYKNSEKIQSQKTYWENINREIPKAKLVDGVVAENHDYGRIKVFLEEETTRELLNEAGKAYKTQINDLLISALTRSIYQWKNLSKVAIKMEGHGREQIEEQIDIDRTVGWFTNMYPVILNCYEEMEENILSTKESFWKVLDNGIGYGLVIEDNQNIPDIVFNYLGDFGDRKKSKDILYSCGESVSKENVLDSLIAIDGGVMNNKLSFDITYNKGCFSEEEIAELGKLYESNINELVEYCMNREKDIYPLTALQEGMLYHNISDVHSTGYILQAVMKPNRILSDEVIKNGLKLLGLRYEVLSTAIVYENQEKPRQILLRERETEYNVIDLSNIHEKLKKEEFKTVVEKDLERGFNLQNDTLIRLTKLKLRT